LASEKESKAIAAEKRKNQPLTHPIIEKLKNKLMKKRLKKPLGSGFFLDCFNDFH
jgi:hypothetical protein